MRLAPIHAAGYSPPATHRRNDEYGPIRRVFHQTVLTQGRIYAPAQAYLARRGAEGKTAREARRALKRLIARRVFQGWLACFTKPTQAVAA